MADVDPSAAVSRVRRVGVDLRSLVGPTTGIGRYTSALLDSLLAQGEFDYLGLAHQDPGDHATTLRKAGLPIEVQRAPLGVLWQQWRLPRRLRRGDIDLYWSPLLTLPRHCPIPSVVTVHDLTPVLYPETQRFKVRLSVLPFLQSTIEAASIIVTGSNATAEELRYHFPSCSDRLEVVYHGVDDAFRPATTGEIQRTRETWNAPEGYILYVGSIEPRKNLSRLLDAWEALREDDADTPPLFLAGPYGWHSRALMRRIRSLEDRGVRHLGRLDDADLIRLFQAARVFVYPSLYEGFGLPPLEAMACGLPTLVSQASSLPEVVDHGGLTVDPMDAAAWAEAIRKVLRERGFAEDLSQRARDRASRFSWPRAAASMQTIFQRALALQ